MNGIHDLGGLDGFGPVPYDPAEPLFQHEWEARLFGLNVVVMANRCFGVDEFRHAIERLDPVRYLTSGYFERWVVAVERLLVEKGYLVSSEIDALTTARRRVAPADPPTRRDDPAATQQLVARLFRLTTPRLEAPDGRAPRFQSGDLVRVRERHPKGHTRAPRYVRGKSGIVDRYQGIHSYPDSYAHGGGRAPQPLYSVRFDGREIWGPDYASRDAFYLDLWEGYLEPARTPEDLS